MINMKKALSLGLACVMSLSLLVGCGGGGGNAGGGAAAGGGADTQQAADNGGADAPDDANAGGEDNGAPATNVETKHHKIGIGHYTDSGAAVDALHAYLDGISPIIDCDFEWVTLSTYDEATNLTAVQNLISSGCEGILLSADMGTQSIIEECASAGVYVAGYLCDFVDSYTQNFDATFGNEYFLGAIADGNVDNTVFGVEVAEKIIEDGYKNVGLITFPSWAYPKHFDIAHAFMAKIDEYNETADEKINYTDITELQFSPLDPNYFSEHPDLDCIYSVAAGANFVYPVMVEAGKTDVKLFCSGFEATTDVENFGSAGNGCFQGICCSAVEAIAYPICLLLDKMNGAQYSDMPAASEVVGVDSYIILSDAEMDQMKKTIYFTGNYADATIKGEDILNMCASYNPDATYAELCERTHNLGI